MTDTHNNAEQLYKTIEPMALMGMPPSVLDMMVRLGAPDLKIPVSRRKFLVGPIICHSRTREIASSHPMSSNPNYKRRIYADRLKSTLGVTNLSVGPTEIAMVMYDASLEAPLHHEQAELYIWAAKHAAISVSAVSQEALDSVPSLLLNEPPEKVLSHPTLRWAYQAISGEIQRKVINASAFQRGEMH